MTRIAVSGIMAVVCVLGFACPQVQAGEWVELGVADLQLARGGDECPPPDPRCYDDFCPQAAYCSNYGVGDCSSSYQETKTGVCNKCTAGGSGDDECDDGDATVLCGKHKSCTWQQGSEGGSCVVTGDWYDTNKTSCGASGDSC